MGVEYHLAELAIAQDKRARGHVLPTLPPNCKSVLDVGCGIGQTLVALNFEGRKVGVDIDGEAIAYGLSHFPQLELYQAPGERLPFRDGEFDALICRVSLSYMDIALALREFARVLTRGGFLWCVLHPLKMALGLFCRQRRLPGLTFRIYVLLHGLLLNEFGYSLRYPLNRVHLESFQTERGMRRLLLRAGFFEIIFRREYTFTVTAHRV
jgi:ubiquinone/menaquinone biosynthesis C-methylase UbiE